MRTGATGLRAWAMQRVTAIYLAVLFVWLLYHFAAAPPADYAAWRAWVGAPAVAIALELGFASLLLHAWIGVRDILIDYVHPSAIRLSLLFVFGFGLAACGLWSLQVIIGAALA
jgi:succinate dehydrogenase / fumarate reductase membrane anchor subunit